ncbi:MAG: DUF494 family protein [bacterium]
MVERIIEILVYVINQIDRYNLNDKYEKFEKLDMKPLFDKGYTENEISTALNWIHDNVFYQFSSTPKKRSSTFRVLTEQEAAAFSPEAYSELIQLHAFGMLSSNDLETILDRATMVIGSPITKEQLLNFIAVTVFNAEWVLGKDRKLAVTMNDTVH